VDSGHETLSDTEVVIDNLSQGSKAVGGARSVGNLNRSKKRQHSVSLIKVWKRRRL
jgi:hypothetical protein